MTNRQPTLIRPEMRDLLLRALTRPKELKKIQQDALRGADRFLELLATGIKLMNERIPTIPPEKMTLAEALEIREIRMGIRSPFQEFPTIGEKIEAKIKARQTLAIRDALLPLIEKVLFRARGWDTGKAMEALLRSMAFLAFGEAGPDKGDLIDQIDQKLSEIVQIERDVYFTFPQGIWGKIKAYPLTENRDQIIFKILADLWGNEFPIVLTQDQEQVSFISWENQKVYFERKEARVVIAKVTSRKRELLPEMEDVWEEIKRFRNRPISPDGRDRVFIPDETPLGILGIRFLRFIQEGILLPQVGLEVELENEKVLLGKINNQGVLLGSWTSSFPMVSWFINYTTLLFLRSLTVRGESYERYQETIKTETGEVKGVREFLIPQETGRRKETKYRYLNDPYFTSITNREIRKIGIRKKPRFHPVITHPRKLLPGQKANPEAIAILKEKGYDSTGLTWVGGNEPFFYRGEDRGEEIVFKPIKVVSVNRQMSKALGI